MEKLYNYNTNVPHEICFETKIAACTTVTLKPKHSYSVAHSSNDVCVYACVYNDRMDANVWHFIFMPIHTANTLIHAWLLHYPVAIVSFCYVTQRMQLVRVYLLFDLVHASKKVESNRIAHSIWVAIRMIREKCGKKNQKNIVDAKRRVKSIEGK